MRIAVQLKSNRFHELAKALEREVARVNETSARRIGATVVVNITNGQKTGRIYPRKGGKTHQASAPGEYPAHDTGALANSYANGVVPLNPEKTRWIIFTDKEYGPPLEFGHHAKKSGTFVEPRPHLTPAVEDERPRYNAAIQKLGHRLK